MTSISFLLFILFISVCENVHTYKSATVHIQRSEDNFILFIHLYMGSWDQTHVSGLYSRYFLSTKPSPYFAGPDLYFLNEYR